MAAALDNLLLRVDLESRNIQKQSISEVDLKMLVGGRSLGSLLLYREITPGIDPLSTDNKLIFTVGPLAGTSAPGSSRFCVLTKSPLTHLYLMSLAGGYFGPELHKAGYLAVIIEGKSENPVYILISDDSVTIKDAGPIWGMRTGDCENFIKSKLEGPNAKIACIGPAGENLVNYACIISGKRAAARGGSGAVMGSKNLKAIVVKGSHKIGLASPEAFNEFVRRSIKEIAENKVTSVSLPQFGTASSGKLVSMGTNVWHNWREAISDKSEYIFNRDNLQRFNGKATRCAPPCPVKCTKSFTVDKGDYSGVTSDPDYETVYALGSCCDITSFPAIINADALCDEYGLDTMSTGVSLAFAMECFEKGIITTKDTGGQDIKFGDPLLLARLIPQIAYRRGFGEFLSLGTKKMSDKIGKGTQAFAMNAKGMELGGYDPRGATGYALIYACGPRGGCHHAGGYTIDAELADGENYRFASEGKGLLVKNSRDRRVLCDSAIMCTFVSVGVSDETIAGLLRTATGTDMTVADLYTLGDRASNIERAFNVREGLRRSWDVLPFRLLKETTTLGPTKGRSISLEPLLDDFYSACGWDMQTGIPTREKLLGLGLKEIVHNLCKNVS